MKVWIEQCTKCYGRLSWEGVDTLVKVAHRNQDTNLTQREIDLAYVHPHFFRYFPIY